MKRALIASVLVLLSVCLAQPAGSNESAPEPTQKLVPWLTIQVKDFGNIVVELFPDIAPQNVKNVETLAAKGFYNGLTFHRLVPGFVIQGGDPAGDGTGGPNYTVPAEISLKHVRGSFAMARTDNPAKASSSCQFYICLQDLAQLDGNYTVIGMTRQGMDVVDKIAQQERDYNDKPVKPVIMGRIVVEMRPPTPRPAPHAPFSGPVFMNIDIKGFGKVKARLFTEDAPWNVASIMALAGLNRYDSVPLRQVIAGSYVQFGDVGSTQGCCGSCRPVKSEFKRPHVRGAVSVGVAASMKKPDVACEFFICLANQPKLDGAGYTVIGEVIEGMSVLDKLAKAKVDADKKPVKSILVTSVTVEEVKMGEE